MARIAITLADGFEDVEYARPRDALEASNHELTLVGTCAGATVTGKREEVTALIDTTAESLYPDEFDALLIPGGHAPDALRLDEAIVSFVVGFAATHKPIAAICHGPQLLIEADAVKGRSLTSWPSVRTDLINAGAAWVDDAVVVDDNLITSRQPRDLDAFCAVLVEKLGG